MRLLSIGNQPVHVAFFRSRADHVQGILKTIRIEREKFVAVFKCLIVIFLPYVVIHKETIRYQWIVALAAWPGRELFDQGKLLGRIRRRVNLRQRVVHLRTRLNRNKLTDLLPE